MNGRSHPVDEFHDLDRRGFLTSKPCGTRRVYQLVPTVYGIESENRG